MNTSTSHSGQEIAHGNDNGAARARQDPKVFVSSTYIDLKNHRAHVIESIRRAGFFVDPMEDWTADSLEPKSFSQQRIDGCDLCVLLVAYRRGYVPDGESLSITQMEYEYAVAHGVDVLVYMLGDKELWHSEYDERRDDPGIGAWRDELRARHGVETFSHDPDTIKVEAALTRWLARSRASQQALNVSDGVAKIAEQVRMNPAVREQAAKFQLEFQQVSQSISLIGDHKDLHDLLHDLQVHAYGPIAKEERYFPDERSVDNLREYELQLALILGRLDEVTSRPSFERRQVAWIQHLYATRDDLQEALHEQASEKLKSAIRRMRSVLATQPSRVDTRLNVLASGLRLDDLVNVISMIGAHVNLPTPDGGSGRKDAAEELKGLGNKLHQLVDNHFRWQELDDDLRRIEDLLEYRPDELDLSWPDVEAKVPLLSETITNSQRRQFDSEAKKLEEAIEAKNPSDMKQTFRRFRALATDHFYEADKKLHDLCGELRVVGEPMDKILGMLREN